MASLPLSAATKSAWSTSFRSMTRCSNTSAGSMFPAVAQDRLPVHQIYGGSFDDSFVHTQDSFLDCLFLPTFAPRGRTGCSYRLPGCFEVSRPQRRFQSRCAQGQYSAQRPEDDDSRRANADAVWLRRLDCVDESLSRHG